MKHPPFLPARPLWTVVAAGALLAAPAFAQTAAPLYDALGARPGLVALVDDFVDRLLADQHMKPFFKDSDLPNLRTALVAQFCEVSGGPCRHEGPNMKKAHDGVDITRADFNALVEVLQQSMDARSIPFGAQNRLLAKLAPMHRDIVNTP